MLQAVDLGGSAVLAGAVAVGHVVPQEQVGSCVHECVRACVCVTLLYVWIVEQMQEAAEKAKEIALGDMAWLEGKCMCVYV